jgi:hypothetical protein
MQLKTEPYNSVRVQTWNYKQLLIYAVTDRQTNRSTSKQNVLYTLQQDRQCTHNVTTVARSRNNCC